MHAKCPLFSRCDIVPKEGPIYLCTVGDHATCNNCFKSSSICQKCKAEIKTRSRGLEEMRNVLPMSCKYRKNGCKTISMLDNLVIHETECEWRPVFCPVLFCNEKTLIFNSIDTHLDISHKSHSRLNREQKVQNNSKINNNPKYLNI
jgi:hypothetical protein